MHINVCIAHVQVAEVVQSMEELVTFTKNLSPGMTNMTKQVDGRTEDLTNPSHADLLTAESDQVHVHKYSHQQRLSFSKKNELS